MAKFCGACGTRNDDDNAVRCSNCGAFFTTATNSPNNGSGNYEEINFFNDYSGNTDDKGYGYNNAAANPQVNYQYIQGADKNNNSVGKIVKIVISLLLAAVLFLGCTVIYEYTGYRAVLNYFKRHFDDYDYAKIVNNYSMVVFETANPDNNYAELDKEAKDKLEGVFSYFDEELGGTNYDMKFKIVDNHIMSDDEYNDFMNDLDYDRKSEIIKDARIVDYKITASLDGKKSSANIELILTLEDENKWKIYSFDEK